MKLAGIPILSLVTFLPIAGALWIAVLNKDAKQNARWIALWFTIITFVVSIPIWTGFDKTNPGFQFVEEARWPALAAQARACEALDVFKAWPIDRE